jgi:Nucleotidyl transferase AbiEii toxin, Type IV TA system
MANTRLKDYYDLYSIAQTHTINPSALETALRRTFVNRATPMFTSLPIGLTEEFTLSTVKIAQWQAFLRRNKNSPNELSLTQVIADITPWLAFLEETP